MAPVNSALQWPQLFDKELMRNAFNRNGSYVVEAALRHCSANDCDAIANGLLAGGVVGLCRTEAGSFVVRALLKVPGECSVKTSEQLKAGTNQVRAFTYRRRLLLGM